VTELKTGPCEAILLCAGCLAQHLRREPAGTQACNVRNCECWCMTEDLVDIPVSVLPVADNLVCDKIAVNLVEFGCHGITGQMVADQLAKPTLERNIIGTLAAGILEANGLTEWKVDYYSGGAG
jgi:hypothetical protein